MRGSAGRGVILPPGSRVSKEFVAARLVADSDITKSVKKSRS
jgi:hypothetical protein